MTGVVDTDVLFKAAQYQLLHEALGSLNKDIAQIGVLGAARFMIRKRLKPRGELLDEVEKVFDQLHVVEPSDTEVKFAGEIEFAAAERDLELDEGESLLFAVVVVRLLDWIVTGDKRAVVALSSMLGDMPALKPAASKVICMEQLFLKVLSTADFNRVRTLVCENRGVDKVLDICFGCALSSGSLDNCTEGLASYIRGLSSRAPMALAAVISDDS